MAGGLWLEQRLRRDDSASGLRGWAVGLWLQLSCGAYRRSGSRGYWPLACGWNKIRGHKDPRMLLFHGPMVCGWNRYTSTGVRQGGRENGPMACDWNKAILWARKAGGREHGPMACDWRERTMLHSSCSRVERMGQ